MNWQNTSHHPLIHTHTQAILIGCSQLVKHFHKFQQKLNLVLLPVVSDVSAVVGCGHNDYYCASWAQQLHLAKNQGLMIPQTPYMTSFVHKENTNMKCITIKSMVYIENLCFYSFL